MQKLDNLSNKYLDHIFAISHSIDDEAYAAGEQADWLRWQRYNFKFALLTLDLNLCRAALGPTLQTERARADIHLRAISKALEIVNLRQTDECPLFSMTW